MSPVTIAFAKLSQELPGALPAGRFSNVAVALDNVVEDMRERAHPANFTKLRR